MLFFNIHFMFLYIFSLYRKKDIKPAIIYFVSIFIENIEKLTKFVNDEKWYLLRY